MATSAPGEGEMALLRDIAFTYDDLDHILPGILESKFPDFTGALYNGDLSLSLAQAQKAKRQWILRGIGFRPGYRVLDIGSGWGNMLHEIREEGGQAVGITLSPAQVASCKRHGLTALLQDWKEVDPETIGAFDAVISVGALEHFCSIEEMLAGKQDEIYDRFFRLCHRLLPTSGRLFLQTMTWGKYAPWGDKFPGTMAGIDRYLDLGAPRMSDERVLGLARAFFPGSWLPRGRDHLVAVAAPYFEVTEYSNGRLDYIQTLTEWEKAWYRPRRGRTWDLIKLAPRYVLGGRHNRAWLESIWESAVREVFVRQIFDHFRIFFRKR